MKSKFSRIIALVLIFGIIAAFVGCSTKKPTRHSTHYGGGGGKGGTISIKPNDTPPRPSADTDEKTSSSDSESDSHTDSEKRSDSDVSSSTSSSTPKSKEPSVDPNLKVGINYTVTGTKNYLAIRNAPYYDASNEIAKMKNGDELTVQSQNVYGDNGEYCYITAISGDAAGQSGYVNKNYITPSENNSSSPQRPKEESSDSRNDTDTASSESEPESNPERHADINESNIFSSIPERFYFMSGVGNWQTEIVISDDGSFKGLYYDANMGMTGSDYPQGTTYICNFTGKFGNVHKIDNYTYSMHVVSLEQEGTEGEEYIEAGIKYIIAKPYGLDDADEVMLYLPGRYTYDLPEDFISWTHIGEKGEPEIPDGVYGLYNVNGRYGFSGQD